MGHLPLGTQARFCSWRDGHNSINLKRYQSRKNSHLDILPSSVYSRGTCPHQRWRRAHKRFKMRPQTRSGPSSPRPRAFRQWVRMRRRRLQVISGARGNPRMNPGKMPHTKTSTRSPKCSGACGTRRMVGKSSTFHPARTSLRMYMTTPIHATPSLRQFSAATPALENILPHLRSLPVR